MINIQFMQEVRYEVQTKKIRHCIFTVADFFIKLTLSLCNGSFPFSAPRSTSAATL